MNSLQSYIFRQSLVPLLAIMGALTAIAILGQSLARLDLIVDQRQSAGAFLLVTLLATPQVLAVVLPLALFFAIVFTMNRLLSENELVVMQASGASRWQIVSPILKLATLAALAHLAVTTLIQPASYREMRAIVYELRADVAASLVREGSFTFPAPGLTIYARQTEPGGRLYDVLIEDSRSGETPVTYTARRGVLAMFDGAPALLMREGQIQQPRPDGGLDVLDFDQYPLDLGAFVEPPESYVLKPSDRYLSELFFPDPTNFFAQRNIERFQAEAHGRIAGPLINIAMALVAAAVMLRGDLQRNGYGMRILRASALALLVRLVGMGLQAGAVDDPGLNPLQYAFPIAVSLAALAALMRGPRPRPARARARPARLRVRAA